MKYIYLNMFRQILGFDIFIAEEIVESINIFLVVKKFTTCYYDSYHNSFFIEIQVYFIMYLQHCEGVKLCQHIDSPFVIQIIIRKKQPNWGPQQLKHLQNLFYKLKQYCLQYLLYAFDTSSNTGTRRYVILVLHAYKYEVFVFIQLYTNFYGFPVDSDKCIDSVVCQKFLDQCIYTDILLLQLLIANCYYVQETLELSYLFCTYYSHEL
eukprot:TRINITY_DN14786_c2_g1_i3.p2 TRINITY_DN14786_c2_g1~~TRINITY_DN14786_c2_g1_i3.p2  ORF type:complete len:209 (-),score=-20.45 TRINITY_DN14786_c2_g1_i3:846-1472(-)